MDLFFNGDWAPSLNELSRAATFSMEEALVGRGAKEFLRFHPECPADEEWLVFNFLGGKYGWTN